MQITLTVFKLFDYILLFCVLDDFGNVAFVFDIRDFGVTIFWRHARL